MIKGFRDFLMRGNIVELAVAVVIGSAFTAVVNSVVSAIIKPTIAALPGGSVNGWGFALRKGTPGLRQTTYLDFSAVLNALIVFVLTAAVVYFAFVVPMNRMAELRARGQEPAPVATNEDTLLLREIRDALLAEARRGGRNALVQPGGTSALTSSASSDGSGQDTAAKHQA